MIREGQRKFTLLVTIRHTVDGHAISMLGFGKCTSASCRRSIEISTRCMLVDTCNMGMFAGRKATFFLCSCIEELDE